MSDHRYSLYVFTKRFLDIVLGSFSLAISIPVILFAALAVRLESPGNPFFVQTRVGLRGRPFTIFKLRGMHIDARDRFPELYDYRQFADLDFYFHYEHDPRITRVGKFIRRTSIDELPNFLNVILGSMTLVGPRPDIPEMLSLYGPKADRYISVKPGVTCLSKITGRDLLTKRESIRLDLRYIQTMSFGLDAKILWRTFQNVLLVRCKLPIVSKEKGASPLRRIAPVSTHADDYKSRTTTGS
jgi:lipopolysaccharide/colanic/teichoic acid biosynthesis glycosyltransferase